MGRPRRTFASGDLVLCFFAPDGNGHEAFGRGWRNDIYQTELSPALSAAASLDGTGTEAFDWLAKLLVAWTDVVAAGATFGRGSQSAEWFETSWANDTFRNNWAFVAASPALFEGAAAETFSGTWLHAITL